MCARSDLPLLLFNLASLAQKCAGFAAGVLHAIVAVEAELPMHVSYTCHEGYCVKSSHHHCTTKQQWTLNAAATAENCSVAWEPKWHCLAVEEASVAEKCTVIFNSN